MMETTPARVDSNGTNFPATEALAMDYSWALRAIGQDLSDLFPRVVEIEMDGANFQVRGQSHPNPFQRVKESALKRTWTKLFSNNAAALVSDLCGEWFTRVYTPEDIQRLDRQYAAHRTGQQKRPDNYSLAERLRVMGSIVNTRRGRFKTLRKHADQLFVDYWDPDGVIQTAKLTTVIMYRNQQQASQSGRPAPRELWEGYDF